jgi:hypothetical protein
MTESPEILAAVEAARAQPHAFVFVPRNAGDDLRAALTELAKETGRQVLSAPAPTRAEIAARELGASERPVVKRSDTRAFLKNIRKIASGDVGVV